MQDTDLYRHLLGITSPWEVNRVELSVKGERVDVWVTHAKGTRFACPECDTTLAVYDHTDERSWRHLDSCQFATFLHAKPPRVECAEHGVRQVALPWAEPMSRFTVLFERLAIDVLKECDVVGACRILRLSWDEGWHLMERAVARGLLRRPVDAPVHLGVDEKAAGRGQFSGVSDPCRSVAGRGLLRGWSHTLWIPCATCRTVSHMGKFRAGLACRADRHAGLLDGGRRRLAASPGR